MIRKVASISLAFLVMVLFSACELSPKTPSELIKRPKLSVKDNIAKEKIQRELPQNAELVRPLKPGSVNSFGYLDLDNDKKNEVYAFYKIPKEQIIGLMILREEDNEWQLLSKNEIAGNDISYADFVDFNSDGYMDLLFGTEVSEGIYGSVNAYLWQESTYKKIWTGEFTSLLIDDMNGNQNKEIICIKHDRNSYSSISVYEFSEIEFKLIDELEMDIYINGYYNVFCGDLTKMEKALFLDYSLGSKAASNIIILKDNKLLPLLPVFTTDESKMSLKTNDIKSKDINDDGIIEIANNYDLIFAQKNLMNKKGIYEWKQYDDTYTSKFKTVAMSYIDKKNYYEFIFPQTWLDAAKKRKITAISNSEGHKRDFISYYYLSSDLDTYHLLTFEYFDKDSYEAFRRNEKNKIYNVVELYKRKNRTLVVYYNKELEPNNNYEKDEYDNLTLDKDEIKSHLVYIK